MIFWHTCRAIRFRTALCGVRLVIKFISDKIFVFDSSVVIDSFNHNQGNLIKTPKEFYGFIDFLHKNKAITPNSIFCDQMVFELTGMAPDVLKMFVNELKEFELYKKKNSELSEDEIQHKNEIIDKYTLNSSRQGVNGKNISESIFQTLNYVAENGYKKTKYGQKFNNIIIGNALSSLGLKSEHVGETRINLYDIRKAEHTVSGNYENFDNKVNKLRVRATILVKLKLPDCSFNSTSDLKAKIGTQTQDPSREFFTHKEIIEIFKNHENIKKYKEKFGSARHLSEYAEMGHLFDCGLIDKKEFLEKSLHVWEANIGDLYGLGYLNKESLVTVAEKLGFNSVNPKNLNYKNVLETINAKLNKIENEENPAVEQAISGIYNMNKQEFIDRTRNSLKTNKFYSISFIKALFADDQQTKTDIFTKTLDNMGFFIYDLSMERANKLLSGDLSKGSRPKIQFISNKNFILKNRKEILDESVAYVPGPKFERTISYCLFNEKMSLREFVDFAISLNEKPNMAFKQGASRDDHYVPENHQKFIFDYKGGLTRIYYNLDDPSDGVIVIPNSKLGIKYSERTKEFLKSLAPDNNIFDKELKDSTAFDFKKVAAAVRDKNINKKDSSMEYEALWKIQNAFEAAVTPKLALDKNLPQRKFSNIGYFGKLMNVFAESDHFFGAKTPEENALTRIADIIINSGNIEFRAKVKSTGKQKAGDSPVLNNHTIIRKNQWNGGDIAIAEMIADYRKKGFKVIAAFNQDRDIDFYLKNGYINEKLIFLKSDFKTQVNIIAQSYAAQFNQNDIHSLNTAQLSDIAVSMAKKFPNQICDALGISTSELTLRTGIKAEQVTQTRLFNRPDEEKVISFVEKLKKQNAKRSIVLNIRQAFDNIFNDVVNKGQASTQMAIPA